MTYRALSLFAGIKLGQVQLAGSASGRAVHGKSGRVSRPSPASYFLLSATPHCGDALAYALRLAPAPLRTLGTREERSGGVYRSASDCRRGQAARALLRDTERPCADCAGRTSSGFRARSALHTLGSSASGSRGRHGGAVRTGFRTGGSSVQAAQSSSRAASGTWPCIGLSTTSQSPVAVGTGPRKTRNVCGVSA